METSFQHASLREESGFTVSEKIWFSTAFLLTPPSWKEHLRYKEKGMEEDFMAFGLFISFSS